MNLLELTFAELLDLFAKLGAIAVLAFMVVAFMKGWLWPKHQVDAVRKDGIKAASEAGKTVAKELIDHFEGKLMRRRQRGDRMIKAIQRSRRRKGV